MPLKDPEARRKYHRDYMRKRWADDPEYRKRHIAQVRKNDARYLAQVDAIIAEWKSDGCVIDGCPETALCCIAHHLDPSTKAFAIGDARAKKIGPKRIKEELAKCICVCTNCHTKIHAGVIVL